MCDKNTGKMDLQGFRVAILVTDGFEQVELEEPRKAVGEFSLGAGGGNRTRMRILITRKLFIRCNARNAESAKSFRFGYAVVTREGIATCGSGSERVFENLFAMR